MPFFCAALRPPRAAGWLACFGGATSSAPPLQPARVGARLAQHMTSRGGVPLAAKKAVPGDRLKGHPYRSGLFVTPFDSSVGHVITSARRGAPPPPALTMADISDPITAGVPVEVSTARVLRGGAGRMACAVGGRPPRARGGCGRPAIDAPRAARRPGVRLPTHPQDGMGHPGGDTPACCGGTAVGAPRGGTCLLGRAEETLPPRQLKLPLPPASTRVAAELRPSAPRALPVHCAAVPPRPSPLP